MARKEAGLAVLRCQDCGHEERLPSGRWDALNDFMQAHKTCQDAAGGRGK
jgi:hypothetical protein